MGSARPGVGLTPLGIGWFIWAAVLYLQHQVSVFNAIMSILHVIIAIILFVMGVVMQQTYMIQRELWIIQQQQKLGERYDLAQPREYQFGEDGRSATPAPQYVPDSR